jgi:tripartite-type tricarboxylate transporter receptor subunit TctC
MKRKFLKGLAAVMLTSCFGLSLSAAHAQSAGGWPAKPIRLIVPFPPAGATDVVSRALGERLSRELGQQFIIENRPGAAAAIGAEVAARAPADGYTLFMGTSSSLVTNRFLFKKLSYDPDGFELISLVCITPLVLLANQSVPVKDVAELVAYAKANPGKLTYASFGSGTTSHLAGEMFKAQAGGVDMLHVPFKGATEALPALIGGQVALYFDTIVSGYPHVKSGKLKALAISTSQRSPLIPTVPTVAEQGFPGYDMFPWYGLVAPKGTPKEVVEKLRVVVGKVLATPEFKEKLASVGAEPPHGGTGPSDFAALIKSDMPKFEKVVKDAGVTMQ